MIRYSPPRNRYALYTVYRVEIRLIEIHDNTESCSLITPVFTSNPSKFQQLSTDRGEPQDLNHPDVHKQSYSLCHSSEFRSTSIETFLPLESEASKLRPSSLAIISSKDRAVHGTGRATEGPSQKISVKLSGGLRVSCRLSDPAFIVPTLIHCNGR